MALFSDAGIQFLFRWIHFLSGITWIGLLYYFNFCVAPFMAEADAATKSGATQKLVPRALWWFRWSAAVTFLAGVVILGLRRASWSDPWGLTILTGAAFGTVMLANVWRVIWPNQKIVIANAVATAGGGQANPAAAGAARRAFLASRTNVVFSFPMLFFMGAASPFTVRAAAPLAAARLRRERGGRAARNRDDAAATLSRRRRRRRGRDTRGDRQCGEPRAGVGGHRAGDRFAARRSRPGARGEHSVPAGPRARAGRADAGRAARRVLRRVGAPRDPAHGRRRVPRSGGAGATAPDFGSAARVPRALAPLPDQRAGHHRGRDRHDRPR